MLFRFEYQGSRNVVAAFLGLVLLGACTASPSKEVTVPVKQASDSGDRTGEQANGGAATQDRDLSEESLEPKEDLQTVDRHGTPMSAECAKALEVIDYLASRCGSSGVFRARNCRSLDADRVISQIAKSGLTSFDINAGATRHYSVNEVRGQLQSRSGQAFQDMAHLGYVYWRGPRHSKASCNRSDAGIIVRLTNKYRLTFRPEHFLSQIEYLGVEGE